jgi:hypothetical protein
MDRAATITRPMSIRESLALINRRARDGRGSWEDIWAWMSLRDGCRRQRRPDHTEPEESPGHEQESAQHRRVCRHCVPQRRVRPPASNRVPSPRIFWRRNPWPELAPHPPAPFPMGLREPRGAPGRGKLQQRCQRNSIALTPGVRYRWTGRGRTADCAGDPRGRAAEDF